MNELDALAMLRAFVRGFRTQGQAAEHLAVSRTYLIDILAERRRLPDAVLDRIGLQRIVTIRRIRKAA